MKNFVLLAVILLSFVSSVSAKVKVVYGDDNREDVYASNNSLYVELAESTAAMIPNTSLMSTSNEGFDIRGRSLESRGMCKSERFSQQMSAANCSGFLVGEDLLVTAGHCITDQNSCDTYKWVFDYKVEYDEQYNVNVNQDSVYGCKEIISRSLDYSSRNDYALIRLDRKVTNRRILNIRRSGKAQVGDKLVVIGHPSGLPTKIADGASIKSLSTTYFSANLDTYGGNSGSAVFNAQTGIVEGILVRGAQDYVYDRSQGCRVTNYLGNNEGRGEEVTYITNIAELQK